MRGPSVRGARRLTSAGVLEQYGEHGEQAQRRNGGPIVCFARQAVRNAGSSQFADRRRGSHRPSKIDERSTGAHAADSRGFDTIDIRVSRRRRDDNNTERRRRVPVFPAQGASPID